MCDVSVDSTAVPRLEVSKKKTNLYNHKADAPLPTYYSFVVFKIKIKSTTPSMNDIFINK
jgi:hypothetical protein